MDVEGDLPGAQTFICDVTDEAAVADVVSRTPGTARVLVNGAAVVVRQPLLETPPSDWRRVLEVNLNGAFVCTQVVGRRMVESGGGAIVNVASTTGTVTTEPGTSAYAASKAALLALTESTAIELGAQGVRCNSVSPGFVRTRATEAAYADAAVHDARAAAVPLGRVGLPEDVADAVAVLVSDEARFVTGQNLIVDGGLTRNLFAQIPGRDTLRRQS